MLARAVVAARRVARAYESYNVVLLWGGEGGGGLRPGKFEKTLLKIREFSRGMVGSAGTCQPAAAMRHSQAPPTGCTCGQGSALPTAPPRVRVLLWGGGFAVLDASPQPFYTPSKLLVHGAERRAQ